jgi:hypothetical protein
VQNEDGFFRLVTGKAKMKEEMEMEFPLPLCDNSNRVKEAGGNPDKLHRPLSCMSYDVVS